MPYDTNGNYSLPTIYYAISGTVINPSQHNTPLEDVRAALNRVFLRDGTAPLTGALQANGNKITGLAKGTDSADAVNVSQLGGYLSLSAGGNITGPVTVSGNPIVVGYSSDHSNYITQLTYDTGAQALAAQDVTGTWRYAQPKGDYATNAQLSAEAQRATTIESNLQSSKVSKSGDTMSGGLTVESFAGVVATASPSSANAGEFINYPAFYSVASGRGGQAVFQLQEHVGTTFTLLMSLQFNDGTWRYVGWSQNKRINDSQYGDVAYTSDLANYQPKGDYAPASAVSYGTITGGTYTKIGNILRQSFVVSNVVHDNTGTWVNYPMAFSNANNITIQTTCNANADMDTFAYGQTATGFYINIPYGSGSSNNPVFVTVEGFAS